MKVKIKKKINSLYIHIPFCRNICPYCDFTKLLKNQNFEDEYIEQIIKDISDAEISFYRFKTIYIGGGTPSCISLYNLEKLLKALNCVLNTSTGYEFTIEANPEDIDENFLKLLKKYGINRISIGVQTFNVEILDSIHRNYNINFSRLIRLVKKYIKNINLDFIYGLPNYTFDVLKTDLDIFYRLKVKHASFYSLIVDSGCIYYNLGINEPSDDLCREYYDFILSSMREHKFERYEVSNYSLPGFESEHNINYWRNNEYLAIGIGASGYVGNIRYTNSKNISAYLKGIRNCEKEIITDITLKEYYFITNLRLKDGFNIDEFNEKFKIDFLSQYKDKINKLLKNNMVSIQNNRFFCTDDGLIILDEILLDLIS